MELHARNTLIPACSRKSRPAHPRRMRGVVLVIALIGMVAMSIAVAYLVKSASVTNQVAGNIAMRQSIERTAAIGFEMAVLLLSHRRNLAPVNPPESTTLHLHNGWKVNLANPAAPTASPGFTCDIGAGEQCWYYPRELFARDARIGGGSLSLPVNCADISTGDAHANVPAGVPVCVPDQPGASAKKIDWFDKVNFKPIDGTGTGAGKNNIPEGYSVRYIIDRQCAAQSINSESWNPGNSTNGENIAPVTEQTKAVYKFCRTREAVNNFEGGEEFGPECLECHTYGQDAGDALTTYPQIYFRVTVQVTGPRATVHFAQALVLI